MNRHVLMLCILGNPYQKVEGGYHKTVFELIEYFKNKDIYITIITSTTSLLKDNFHQKYPNIDFWELALPSEWIKNQDELFINADYIIKKVQKIICNYSNSISMLHSFQWINGYIALKVNIHLKVFHAHSIISSSYEREKSGFELRSKYQRYCEECTFKSSDLLISITQAEKEQLINYYNVPSSKIEIVGRSVDLYYSYFRDIRYNQLSKKEKLNIYSISESFQNDFNQKAFVYIGRIIEYKGILEIFIAWENLYKKYKEKIPPLWIIGGKETDINLFRHFLMEKNPSLISYEKMHKIYWWGYMESYGISTILQKSHVLLMHSAFEPGGRVVLEAMASSKPIIATPTGFAQTYIKNWYNGFQVEYQDIKCLTYCMEFFVRNEYLSNTIGIKAKKTYDLLNKKWQYYEWFDALYCSNRINTKGISDEDDLFTNKHPFLIDEFPYCDIKNTCEDLTSLINDNISSIQEDVNYQSYIWEITTENGNYLVKQFYNRLNISQMWNYFDSHKVHTVWMQYHTSILSMKYNCFLEASILSEKLFSYVLPACEILSNDKVVISYPNLLKHLSLYETGKQPLGMSINDTLLFYENLNRNIQYKHKYYTLDVYAYELRTMLDENSTMFTLNEICYINQIFKKIELYLFSRTNILYGLNYGKSFFGHVMSQKDIFLLLPSSDIYIGELGQDEGMIYFNYYLQYHSFIKTSYYPRKKVLTWTLLHCMGHFISCRILLKSCMNLCDFKAVIDEFNNEK